jgi:protein-S-isoprenylcysteine O-methyltransferase Ste14
MRMVRSTVRMLGGAGVVLFVSAGTFVYWQAWWFLFLNGLSSTVINLYLLRNDPALLHRRLAAEEQGETQPVHKLFMLLLLVLGVAQLVVTGLDHRRGWSEVSLVVLSAASFVFMVGAAVIFWVLRTNSHASSIITVEEHQPVISHGPYRWVRHPMYTGFLLMFATLPLVCGSYRGEAFFLPQLVLFIVRLLAEEKFLKVELPGYATYMDKTPRRLVPGVW